MRKRLTVAGLAIIGSIMLVGCGKTKNSTPAERTIKEDIANNYKEFLNLDAYIYADIYGLYGSARQERDINITSLKIQKSKTDDDSYSAWCDITFEDEYYKDFSVIVVTYNKYDNGYWEIRDMYEEENTRRSEVLQVPPEAFIENMVSSMYGTSNEYCYWPEETLENTLENQIWHVKMNITNDLAFQGNIEDSFPAKDIVEGYNTIVKADVDLTLEYDGVNTWYLSDFESELPDSDDIVKDSASALIKSARFVLNGDRNIDSLYVESSWSDGTRYYFDIAGTGGVVVLCEDYDPEKMDLKYVGLDVSRWDYQYGKMTEGHALFYDPGKFLVPHL